LLLFRIVCVTDEFPNENAVFSCRIDRVILVGVEDNTSDWENMTNECLVEERDGPIRFGVPKFEHLIISASNHILSV